MNFDNAVDVVSIEPKRLKIHTRDEAAAAWTLAAEMELPEGLEQFVMADLFMVDSTRRPMTPTVSAARDEDAAAAAEAARRFDTYQSVIAFGPSGLRLIRVDLDEADAARLQDVTEASGIAGLSEVRAVLPIDIEHDGDLDLVTSSAEGIRVWSNRGNMSFDNISEFSVLPPADVSMATMVAVDWDRDVDLDIVASGPQADSLGVLENVRHGQFRWRPLGDEFTKFASASSLSLVDADSNVSWDLVAVGESGAALLQTSTPLPGTVKALAEKSFSEQAARRGMTVDFDNDSFTDFVTLGDDGLRVFRGRGSAGFVPFDGALPEPISPAAFDVADLDADGDLDLAVATGGGIQWLLNDGGNRNHWIDLRVRGIDPLSPSGRVNHFAIGSLVEVRSGLRYQPFVISQPTTHVGLGRVEQPDLVRVTLTNGIPQVVLQPQADQVVFEKMILKGSCPFAYTWIGERFEFFTDLLWAAPLGLQSAEGVLAPSRPWEYLLLPGDRLAAKDGEYVLQVTEELWEAGYFDQIELIAVDHPSDVAIYSNEKVGPPSIAEFQLHAVRQPRRSVSANDQAGRDWSAALAERDGRYAVAFDGRIRQGLTEPTYIELDLGQLDSPERITLFLTGWIQPGDTSLNIALSQDPRLEAARYPSIQTPDAEGNWRETVPFMGFPGGKPKTIAVDLSDVFTGDDYRLRIATTAEIYWDEAFFTVDEAAVETRTESLLLVSADLHYRGFSARLPRGPHEPER
ncbi:MAG: CRTAC1 family protein, partial [Planctomycetales bacterium]|nr:CRTAC1 family protein [Planctomycetales bacterium]